MEVSNGQKLPIALRSVCRARLPSAQVSSQCWQRSCALLTHPTSHSALPMCNRGWVHQQPKWPQRHCHIRRTMGAVKLTPPCWRQKQDRTLRRFHGKTISARQITYFFILRPSPLKIPTDTRKQDNSAMVSSRDPLSRLTCSRDSCTLSLLAPCSESIFKATRFPSSLPFWFLTLFPSLSSKQCTEIHMCKWAHTHPGINGQHLAK